MLDKFEKMGSSTKPRLTTSLTPSKGHYLPFSIMTIKVLLLENIDPVAINLFTAQGYEIETIPKALTEDELVQKIRDIHILCIRSKTQVTRKIVDAANQLLAIGCFCIGTDQVDVDAAVARGIVVFNSPFSNSRSVAEMVLAEIIVLARRLGDRNNEMHSMTWNKSSKNCHEVRGKTLGIIGYGHIGSQLSVLAEALGMIVIYYDIQLTMPHGLARSMDSMTDLIKVADFVTLHVPDSPETRYLIGEKELATFKKGAYLINASRGKVVDLDALKKSLLSSHLSGAALDVFPAEPSQNGPIALELDPFMGLEKCPNVLLTPHIGGSTEEAQRAIGNEVASSLIKFIHTGSTLGSVSFPEVDLRSTLRKNQCRIINVHKNVPGVLKTINKILSDYNIAKQTSESKTGIAYLLVDIDDITDYNAAAHILDMVQNEVSASLCTRLLYQEGQLQEKDEV